MRLKPSLLMTALCLLMSCALAGCGAFWDMSIVEQQMEEANDQEVSEEPMPVDLEPTHDPYMATFTTQLADPFPNFEFDYPVGWSIQEDGGDAGAYVNVASPAGVVVTLRVAGAQTDSTGILESKGSSIEKIAPCQLTAANRGRTAAQGPFVVAELNASDALFVDPATPGYLEGDLVLCAVVPEVELSHEHPQLLIDYGDFANQEWGGITTVMFYCEDTGLSDAERDQVAEILSSLRRVDGGLRDAVEDAFIANVREFLRVPDDPAITWIISDPFYWEGGGMYLRDVTFYENGEVCAGADCDERGYAASGILMYKKPA